MATKINRKTMILDVFTFNGEFDLLELRFNILKPYVDEFIIVEADTTFSGIKKELYFPLQAGRYKDFPIRYCVIEQDKLDQDKELNALADVSPSCPDGMHWWHREFRQKESIRRFLTHLDDEDIVYISDCDEIWKPKEIGEGIYKLRQLMYTYYLNNRTSESWAGTFVTKYKNIKNGNLNYMRQLPPKGYEQMMGIQDREFLDDGGWHFTSMGGVGELKRKIESYGHQELNIPQVKDNLENAIKTNTDFIGRDFKFWTDESEWPEYLKDNRQKYINMLK